MEYWFHEILNANAAKRRNTYLGFQISRREAKRISCARRILSHSAINSRR